MDPSDWSTEGGGGRKLAERGESRRGERGCCSRLTGGRVAGGRGEGSRWTGGRVAGGRGGG
jgi:hypothetical protein